MPPLTQLTALTAHLRARREPLLQEWRELIDLDPQLTSYRGLGRRALDDHVPTALDNFELRLRAEHDIAVTAVELKQLGTAAEHASQRWQVGYRLSETLREWGHLHRVLIAEITRYGAEHVEFDRDAYYAACLALAEWTLESVSESGTRYVQFQQAEATNRVRALQTSLDELQKIENERAALLRGVAHDLRGSAAVVANVSMLLERPQVEGSERQRFYSLLQQRIQAMGALLTQLMVWARLETGQDALQLEQLDIAGRLRTFCDEMRPIAEERGLFLQAEGPSELVVETDALKLQRIVQNLLLNALRATENGGITVRWGSGPLDQCWTLSIQDTGVGLKPKAVQDPGKRTDATRHLSPSETSVDVPHGEGLGLLIVEGLCEVLKAKLTIQGGPVQGTNISIALPARYPDNIPRHVQSPP